MGWAKAGHSSPAHSPPGSCTSVRTCVLKVPSPGEGGAAVSPPVTQPLPCCAAAGRNRAFRSPSQLFAASELQHLFLRPSGSGGAGPPSPPGKVLFVFGREESGLTEEEIASCDCVCSIPIGRLQESLSLSHAVSLVLSQLFELRLGHSGAVPSTIEELAAGCPGDESGGE